MPMILTQLILTQLNISMLLRPRTIQQWKRVFLHCSYSMQGCLKKIRIPLTKSSCQPSKPGLSCFRQRLRFQMVHPPAQGSSSLPSPNAVNAFSQNAPVEVLQSGAAPAKPAFRTGPPANGCTCPAWGRPRSRFAEIALSQPAYRGRKGVLPGQEGGAARAGRECPPLTSPDKDLASIYVSAELGERRDSISSTGGHEAEDHHHVELADAGANEGASSRGRKTGRAAGAGGNGADCLCGAKCVVHGLSPGALGSFDGSSIFRKSDWGTEAGHRYTVKEVTQKVTGDSTRVSLCSPAVQAWLAELIYCCDIRNSIRY